MKTSSFVFFAIIAVSMQGSHAAYAQRISNNFASVPVALSDRQLEAITADATYEGTSSPVLDGVPSRRAGLGTMIASVSGNDFKSSSDRSGGVNVPNTTGAGTTLATSPLSNLTASNDGPANTTINKDQGDQRGFHISMPKSSFLDLKLVCCIGTLYALILGSSRLTPRHRSSPYSSKFLMGFDD